MPKNAQTTAQLHSSLILAKEHSHSPSKVSIAYEQWLPFVQAGFRKGRGTRDQIANIRWILEKAGEFQKNIHFCIIDYAKTFVWITINCGKFLKWWGYHIILPASWEIYMQVKKQQLELDMKQWTGSKFGKSTSRLYIVTMLI